VFSVAAEAYDRFMGKYSAPLAPLFAEFAGFSAGGRILDVGCGPGALTGELVRRLGPEAVAAVDPSEPFVEAAHERNPGVEVRRASVEELPFPDAAFGASLAQLVVHFMGDPVAGLAEMARVTRSDGVVAACVWDHVEQGPLRLFWESARELDPDVEDESRLPGVREGHLAELLRAAGLRAIEQTALRVEAEHESFDAWWEPFTHGVGPAGVHLSGLDATGRSRLRELCRERFEDGSAVRTARAWAARGLV
jgi:SAM-dependent methyltransferase